MKKNVTPTTAGVQIIGCGLTGMIMALALAHHGIASTILERSKSDKFPEDVRTTAFTRKTQEFLESIGVWNLFDGNIGEIKDIYVVDNKSPRILHMGHEEAHVPVIGYIIQNDILKKTLYTKVSQTKLIEVKKGCTSSSILVSSSKISGVNSKFHQIPEATSSLEDDNCFPPLTLICEGRASPFKDLFETRINKDYGQSAIVLISEHEKAHEGTAIEHFMPSGPFASLPMKDPHKSSIVWTEKREIAELYHKMSIGDLTDHLQEKFGEFLGKVKIISNVQTFPLTAFLTKTYVKNNIVLVGDIAHAIHPLAGQGLNQGIKDIEELANIISKRLKNGLKIDQIALAEYEKARIRDNYNMFLLTDNINRVFSNDIKPLALVRRLGMSILNEMGSLKHKIVSYGMGIR